ncbi:MAG: aminotransferase class V-fold PLP-dependent enzyme [Boseongicola sp. SB0677_bin_26]|nr:aminotransferase class V-fold PLP-dependent enzyme [Boseongicola sp. SB0677_bin_26]
MADTIYLDYAATTPADPAVVDAMLRYMGPGGVFANPASNTHLPGQEAAVAVDIARDQVAALMKAAPDQIVWTSGATESINLAIKGAAAARRSVGRHIVTSCLEHSAALGACRHLASEGYEIKLLKPNRDGLVSPEAVRGSLREDTALISLMQVNNETGTITDVEAIGEIARERGIPFHVDAAQSLARLPVNVSKLNADFVSVSGHKMYGPKGIGALYIRSRSTFGIDPQIHGGDQEMGLRAGTLPTHQIVGMGKAAEILMGRRDQDLERARELEGFLLSKFAAIPRTSVNGGEPRVVGIANLWFACVESESLALAIRDEVAISSGSACTSARVEPSHVLLGLGLSEDEAHRSIRVSLGRFTSQGEVERAACRIEEAVGELRSLSDEWEDGGEMVLAGVGER